MKATGLPSGLSAGSGPAAFGRASANSGHLPIATPNDRCRPNSGHKLTAR